MLPRERLIMCIDMRWIVLFSLLLLSKCLILAFGNISDVKMAPRMAAVLRAPGKLCSFLFVFLLFYVLDVVSITVYDRDMLLNIGSSVAQRKPDFEFLNAGGLFTDTASEPFVWVAKSRRRRRKRGKRAGVLVRLLSDLLFQPFYWPTFSHWITNSANCGRASHTNEK